jgi:hypothetical protein
MQQEVGSPTDGSSGNLTGVVHIFASSLYHLVLYAPCNNGGGTDFQCPKLYWNPD